MKFRGQGFLPWPVCNGLRRQEYDQRMSIRLCLFASFILPFHTEGEAEGHVPHLAGFSISLRNSWRVQKLLFVKRRHILLRIQRLNPMRGGSSSGDFDDLEDDMSSVMIPVSERETNDFLDSAGSLNSIESEALMVMPGSNVMFSWHDLIRCLLPRIRA